MSRAPRSYRAVNGLHSPRDDISRLGPGSDRLCSKSQAFSAVVICSIRRAVSALYSLPTRLAAKVVPALFAIQLVAQALDLDSSLSRSGQQIEANPMFRALQIDLPNWSALAAAKCFDGLVVAAMFLLWRREKHLALEIGACLLVADVAYACVVFNNYLGQTR